MILKINKNINLLLNSSQKKSFWILVLMNIFNTLLEMLSIGLIPVLISVLIESDQIVKNFSDFIVVTSFFQKSFEDQFFLLSLVIIFIFIIKNVFAFYNVFYEGKFLRDLKYFYTVKFYNLYINFSFIKLYDYNISELQKNIIQETKLSSEYVYFVALIIKEILLFIGIFTVVIFFNLSVALSILLFLSSISIIYYFFFKRRIRRDSLLVQKIRAFQIKSVNQVFASLKETKILNTTKYFIEDFKKKAFEFENVLFLISLIGKLPRFIIEVLLISIILLFNFVLIKSGYVIQEVIPLIGLLVVASIRLMPSFNTLTASFTKLKSYEVSVELIINELSKNYYNKNSYKEDLNKIDFNNLNFEKKIKLENISFSFSNKKNEILSNCTIDIIKGEKIGIVGPSGSGKSTLLGIILGFLKPQNGRILVDNKDINQKIESWHSKIGYIPQEIYLLDDTIINNVALGIKNNEGITNKVVNALQLAEVYDFIKELPEGLNTIVGDRGVKLSGGQRQRIGIARALLRNPDILILDEATSSLDGVTEEKFIENVFNLGKDKTIIISTHKIQTLKNCDRVFTIKNKSLEIL